MTNKDFETAIVIPDLHAPWHDAKSLRVVLDFIKEKQPEIVVLLGDVVDMYAVSRFDKDAERANRLQDELDSAHEVLKQIREAAPKATIKYCEGNHEFRLTKYLRRNQELHDLRSLKIPALLRLKELNIEYVDEWCWKDTFLFTHGNKVVKYSAQKELNSRGVSGMSGHVHRVQSYSVSDYNGTRAWYSCGHLCDEGAAEYTETSHPDWQQGFGVVYFSKKSKRFHAEVVQLVHNSFMYSGKVYE